MFRRRGSWFGIALTTLLVIGEARAQFSFWHLPEKRTWSNTRDPKGYFETLGAASSIEDTSNLHRASSAEKPSSSEKHSLYHPFDFLVDFATSNVNFSAVTVTFETGRTTPETCTTCEYVMDVLKKNSGRYMSSALVAFLWAFCYMNQFTTTEVCQGLIRTYKDELVYVMSTTRSSPNELCTLMFGHTCGNLTSPEHIWEVQIPPRKMKSGAAQRDTKQVGQPLRVLHVSDTHYDPEYKEGSLAECEEPLCCREDSGDVETDAQRAGRWGDYRMCDLPFRTFDHMLSHIAANDQFDFAYWTGDQPPHDLWKITQEDNVKNFATTADTLAKRLQGHTVYPVVGNHEAVPPNLFPLLDAKEVRFANKSKWLYDVLAESWNMWLSKEALRNLTRGGYYVARPAEGLRLISLNTNFCYQFNFWLLINSTDPGGQLSWLIDQLLEAEEAGDKAFPGYVIGCASTLQSVAYFPEIEILNADDKVHLIGHIPPGLPDCIETWSAMFHKIIERFSETVTGQFYGHTHYDEFSVFYKSEERTKPFAVAYIGPSATTYAYLNPAYRIYDLDTDTKAVSSHETYSMNLTEANESGEPSWRLEYRSGDLGLSGADPAEWDALVRRMASDDELFDRVQGYSTRQVGEPSSCTGQCKELMLCRLRTDRSHDYSAC